MPSWSSTPSASFLLFPWSPNDLPLCIRSLGWLPFMPGLPCKLIPEPMADLDIAHASGWIDPELVEIQTPALLLTFAHLLTKLVLPATEDLIISNPHTAPQITHSSPDCTPPCLIWLLCPHSEPFTPWTSHWTVCSSGPPFHAPQSQISQWKTKALPGSLPARSGPGNHEGVSFPDLIARMNGNCMQTAPKLEAAPVYTSLQAFPHEVIAHSGSQAGEWGHGNSAYTLAVVASRWPCLPQGIITFQIPVISLDGMISC